MLTPPRLWLTYSLNSTWPHCATYHSCFKILFDHFLQLTVFVATLHGHLVQLTGVVSRFYVTTFCNLPSLFQHSTWPLCATYRLCFKILLDPFCNLPSLFQHSKWPLATFWNWPFLFQDSTWPLFATCRLCFNILHGHFVQVTILVSKILHGHFLQLTILVSTFYMATLCDFPFLFQDSTWLLLHLPSLFQHSTWPLCATFHSCFKILLDHFLQLGRLLFQHSTWPLCATYHSCFKILLDHFLQLAVFV